MSPVGREVAAARSTLVAVCVVLLVTAGLTASAVWGGTGRGVGVGKTGTAVPVTLSPGTPTGDLHPGGRTDVLLRVSNPNPFPVRLGSLALDPGHGPGGLAVDPGHAGCGLSELSYTRQTNGGSGWTVPARTGSTDGSLTVRLPDALTMSTTAANACQGAQFTAYLVVGS